ncbi:hypothetical protein N7512_001798 [Penicillium capsulatum]|nr:hypothetical protein N7512_001798 [Penicillium capsulatum]
MQFKDLQISLQKDPRGGPPIPMSELIPEGTKKFLGLTKLYRERYFRLPRSRFPGYPQIHSIFLPPESLARLLVPLDPNKSDWYIFCKTELVNGIPTIQRTVQTSKSAMSTLLVTFGEIRGWKGMPISSVMDVRAQFEDHPELEEVRRNLSKVRAQYEKTQQRALLPRIQQLEKEIRVNFDEEQAFLDIEAQLSGTVVKEESEDENPVALPAPDPVAEDAPADTTSDPEFTGDLKRMGDGCGLRFNLPSLKCTDSGTGAIPELNYDTEADKCWMSYDGHLDPIDPIHHVCSSATVEFDSQGYTKLTNKQGETVIFQFSDRKVLQDRVEFALQTVKSKNPDSSFPS